MSTQMAHVACKSSLTLHDLKQLRESEGRLTIYISGPMTGHRHFNHPEFFRIEEIIQDAGHIPLNPARNPKGLSYEQYMKISFSDLFVSNAVIRLGGWMESKGALAEVFAANSLGLMLIDES
ncbi:DUF4406 domain-containing protein [Vibrio anguillarum]|uniref:DUF4406 domain-containing protein n=1 Tax=Vibrio anguillarum TaxID=55601 RepID=UPI001AD7F93A|nr:DUF4406 domain-containing protein [Vibrio anguillarum]MBT2909467.1 DUF4406 domain-containing protein [Vibrio anguillarum]MBT2942507.1 DUF4406 domain-containing protein [Vibrio anguillarum]MBT2950669.1 DUF4406 domain-containing protein [Vibrio anguillarum]MBT2979596.1 DUF4406 domain-containing protein [Vibrio anguillarum]